MALSRYTQHQFGMTTRPIINPETDTCATSVTRLLANNPDRLGSLIMNIGGNDIHVLFDNRVSTTRGILLAAEGGKISLNANEDYELVGYPVYGIASGGSSEVIVIEIEAEPGA